MAAHDNAHGSQPITEGLQAPNPNWLANPSLKGKNQASKWNSLKLCHSLETRLHALLLVLHGSNFGLPMNHMAQQEKQPYTAFRVAQQSCSCKISNHSAVRWLFLDVFSICFLCPLYVKELWYWPIIKINLLGHHYALKDKICSENPHLFQWLDIQSPVLIEMLKNIMWGLNLKGN